jgi:hypothetical protein
LAFVSPFSKKGTQYNNMQKELLSVGNKKQQETGEKARK